MFIAKSRRFFILALLWSLFLIFLSIQPGDEVSVFLPFDILSSMAHATVYLVLAILLALAFRFKRYGFLKLSAGSFCLSVFWGLVNEVVQIWVPTRSADLMDVLSDAIGALLGLMIFVFWRKRKKR